MLLIALLAVQSPATPPDWPAADPCRTGPVSGGSLVQHLLTGSTSTQGPYQFEFGGPTLEDRITALYQNARAQAEGESAAARLPSSARAALRACGGSGGDVKRTNWCRARDAFADAGNLFRHSDAPRPEETRRLTRVDGGVARLPDAQAAADRTVADLTLALFTDPTGFQIVCASATPPPPPADTPQPRPAWRFVVTGERSDITQQVLGKRSFASWAWTDRVRDDRESWDVDIVAGASRTWSLDRPGAQRYQRFTLAPFFSFRRAAGDVSKPEDEINEAALGAAASLTHVRAPGLFSGIHILSGDLRYLTDDSLDARALALEWRYTLPLSHTPGYGRWWTAGIDGLQFSWDADTVLEAVWIDNPGDTFPAGLQDHRRIGADAQFALRYRRAGLPFTPGLAFSYQVRDDFDSSGAADAALFTGAATVKPGENSHVEFSLQYLTGQDLTKLTERQEWSLRIGYRY